MNSETSPIVEELIRLLESHLGIKVAKTNPHKAFMSCRVNLAHYLYFAGMDDVRLVGVLDPSIDAETLVDSYRELIGRTPQWRESIKLLALPTILREAQTVLKQDSNTVIVTDDMLPPMEGAKTLIAPLRQLLREQLGTQRLSPYQSRGAVTGNRFFGRDLQMGAIIKHPERSYLVTGTRMSGKTSLLREALRRLDERDEKAIYVDCKRFNTIAGLINGILTELEVRDSFIKYERWESPQRWHEFFKYLRVTSKQLAKKQLHIFLDEYDSLTEIEKPDAQISWNFRALHQENSQQRGIIQFVFAGSKALASAARNNDSPFYNFVDADDCHLDNFDLGTVRKVLEGPMRDLGIKTDDSELAAEELLLETAGRPSSVQYVCAAVVKQLDSGKQLFDTPNTKPYNIVTAELITQVAQSPEYHHYYQGILLENTSPLERFVLTVYSERGAPDNGFTQEHLSSTARSRHRLYLEPKALFEALDNLVKSGFITLDRSVPGRYHVAAPVIKRICRQNDARSIVSDLIAKKLGKQINL
jgi:AAA domain